MQTPPDAGWSPADAGCGSWACPSSSWRIRRGGRWARRGDATVGDVAGSASAATMTETDIDAASASFAPQTRVFAADMDARCMDQHRPRRMSPAGSVIDGSRRAIAARLRDQTHWRSPVGLRRGDLRGRRVGAARDKLASLRAVRRSSQHRADGDRRRAPERAVRERRSIEKSLLSGVEIVRARTRPPPIAYLPSRLST